MTPPRGLSEADASIVVAILAALFAALGYVGKLVVDVARAAIERRAARRAKLVEIDSLLRASRAVFVVQNELAIRLEESLSQSQPDTVVPEGAGYEETFVAGYAEATPAERELHGLIRSMTETAMRELNEKMLAWLAADTHYKGQRYREGPAGVLAGKLAELEAHLHMWQAKRAYWMEDPRHALVYLADEEKHGVGFPRGLDEAVREMLGERAANPGSGAEAGAEK
jgi:hypothetical protein